jgi:predicted nucleic acid-binding protein
VGERTNNVIYLDSSFLIYFMENPGIFGETARRLVKANPDTTFCISPLVSMECLIKPIRMGNTFLENQYLRFFLMALVLPIPVESYEQATRLRAIYQSLRTPDAIPSSILKCNDGVWVQA